VTGGRGLCGRAIVEAAKRSGQWEVFTVARSYSLEERHVVHDLRQPIARNRDSFPDSVDAIIHAAAQVDQTDDTFDVVEANTRAAYHLAEFAADVNCRQLVHLSSVAVFGAPTLGEVVVEDSPERPRTPYGLSKLLAERVFESWLADYDSLLQLRLGYIVGEGMGESTLIRRLARARVAGERVQLVNPEDTRIQFLDADDVAAICLAALDRCLSGTMIAAGRERHSIEDIWRMIAGAIAGQSEVTRANAPELAYDTHYQTMALERAGLGQFTPFSATIGKAVADLRLQAA